MSSVPTVIARPRPGTAPVPVVPRPERFALGNGLRVAVVRRGALPQAAGRLIVPAGAAADPQGLEGLAALVGALLLEGSTSRSAIELHQRIDYLGASLDARVGHDFAEIDLSLLSETLEEGLALLAEVVTRPTFPERELERIRAETLDALEARLDEPANIADDAVAEAVFGTHHPYGRLAAGRPESVAEIGREHLEAFHRRHYLPAGCVLVLAGDLGTGDVRALLERVFAGWEGEAPHVGYPEHAPLISTRGILQSIQWPDAAQAEIRVAGLGMPRDADDWIPASVANYVLGGSTITGRLGSNLREEKGWTYGVRSGFAGGLRAAGWSVETAVGAEVAEDALAEIEKELLRMVTEDVAEDELDRAREALILSLPRAFETPGRIVARLATSEAYGLPADYWETMPEIARGVDVATVRRIAGIYFEPAKLARVTVGPDIRIEPEA